MASTGHGGYLFRLEALSVARLVAVAREALGLEQEGCAECFARLSLMHPGKIVVVSYRGPFSDEGDPGRWYLTHHALARLLSCELTSAVHAYALDPDELEEVTSYANGRRVGGERLEYAHVDVPDDDNDFLEIEKENWPLGHLARILGVERDLLESIPGSTSVLLSLDEGAPQALSWETLLEPLGWSSPAPRRSLP